MRIYQAEKDDGIDFQINQAGSSSAFVTAQVQVCDIEKYFEGMSVADLVRATSTVQTVEELLGQGQPDLALIVAILVSTGWNLNDDVFTPEEVWKARFSPLHKPMNDNHQADKILGHIVQSRVLDKSGNAINEKEYADQPPAEFDIEVAGVLYRAFPELSQRIDEIIALAKSGAMFVSMEAWFPDFGYGMIDPVTGNTKLIDRNERTAFLTKHLRIYGGSGEYQGYKIGRVLKDIIFGAQGFTNEPANPDSVIKVAANKVAASNVFVTAELSELSEGGVEDVDEKQMKELQAKLDEAQASLEAKDQEIAKLQEAVAEVEAKNFDGQITILTEKVNELTASVTEASQKVEALEVEKAELQKQLDEVTERADKSEAEIAEIRKTEAARERLAKLAEVKTIENEETALADLRNMSDETFAAVLKYAGELKAEEETKPVDKESEGAEQAEAALNDVEEGDDGPDFNATDDAEKSEDDQWMSTAKALCGRKDEED
jgi:hypothetical protein